MDREYAAQLVKKLCSYTKYYAVVNIEGRNQGVTRFANSEISQNVNQSDVSVTLTLHDGKKEATCSTNVLDDDGLKKLASDTEAMLEVSPPGDFEYVPWRKSTLRKIENDPEITRRYDAKGRVDAVKEGVSGHAAEYTAAGALILEKKLSAYGNSESEADEVLFAELDNVQFNTVITNSVTKADGSGESISHRTDGLKIAEAFSQAKQRAVMGANPITLPGGEYTVVLTPQALGDLAFFVGWSLNAKRVADGMSFASAGPEHIEAPNMGRNISIYDDVNDPRVFPWYFDYEGFKRRPIPLVEKGDVKNLLHDTKTARLMKKGGKPSGHALTNKGMGGFARHMVVLGGYSTQDEIIRGTERGLFISNFHYTNFVNPRSLQVTGLTRNGTFLIENGKITNAVSTMRFTQNLLEAFNNVMAVSRELTTVDAGGWAAVMPSVVIEGFAFP